MAKRFHYVTISVFLKQGEKPDFLDELFPVPVQSFLEQQFVYDQNHERTKVYIHNKEKAQLTLQEAEGFEGSLIVMKFKFSKITHTNQLFEKIYTNLSPEDQLTLKENALEFTDAKGQLIIRLNKDLTNYELARGDVIQCVFLIAAYPKNEKTIKENVRALFIWD